MFDGFLVLGSEAGVKAAIDASKDGPTLSDDDAYRKATENAASDRLGLFYVNSPEFLNVARENGTADTRLLQEVLPGADRRNRRRGRRRRGVRGERPAAARAVVRVLRRGQRRARRHAGGLVARGRPEGLRQAARLLRRRVRRRGGRPRRHRGAVQGGHGARPAEAARLDGRLRRLRARHHPVEPGRRARDRDLGRSGVEALPRGGGAAGADPVGQRHADPGTQRRIHRDDRRRAEADRGVRAERQGRGRIRRCRGQGRGRLRGQAGRLARLHGGEGLAGRTTTSRRSCS